MTKIYTTTMSYVCILGGANIDVFAHSHKKIIIHDSNPSTITTSLGGVGRNISENLARLGQKVFLLTILGDDVNSKLIEDNANLVGIDLSKSKKISGITPTYMCMNDVNGDMVLGASDMTILEHLNQDFVQDNLPLINGSKAVVIDTNVPQIIELVCKKSTVPVFLDTVSASKTKWITQKDFKVFCLKPNVIEAEILSGTTIQNEQDLKNAMRIIQGKFCQWVVVTNGKEGVHFYDGKDFGFVPAKKVNAVNTTGAGDSFFGAMVYGFVNGWDIEKCTHFGCLVASKTVCSKSTVSQEVNKELLEQFNKEYKNEQSQNW